jgi:hypothetical protein
MRWKWLVITLSLIVVCGIAVYFYLRINKSDDFEGLIKTKIAALVNKGSDGLYNISIEDIEIDVLNSTVIAQNVLLFADSARIKLMEEGQKLPDDIYEVAVKSIVIKGISPQDFLNTKQISLQQVFIDQPDVKITHQKRPYNRKDSGNFYSRIAAINESYSLKNLTLQNIKLTYKNLSKNNQVSVLQNLTVLLNDIRIDKETAEDSTRFLFANDAAIYLKEYAAYTADKLYRFTIDSVTLKPMLGLMSANNVRLNPQGSKDEFSKKLKVLKDRFDIRIEKATVKNINWWALISDEGLFGENMTLSGGYINVYDDRRLPAPESKMGNFPHQLLMKVKFPVKMNSITITDVDVSYEELNPVTDKSGSITFGNTSGELKNVTNIPVAIAANPLMTVTANTILMNEGKLHASFVFNLSKSTAGVFSVDATLGPMDGTKANKAVNGLAMVEIEKLQIDKLEMHVTGSNNKANGTVRFAYHDLKIAALKKDKNEDDGFKKRKLLSFIANTFVVKSSSPAKTGDTPKTQIVSYDRDPKKSFFNLVWQTVAKGIVLTARGK